ncbi:hypothetical protein C2G38_2237940 [Gigaspora rosea]|uniref:HMG box domain-containing protein n=1 Tax=Gigaspora rosea TaxID=44941 RepID=A0A397WAX1_9GLOM|nr:hypothetical protein C2G38_2237940 [Gigaspora rosea]
MYANTTTFKELLLQLGLDESAIWNPPFSLRQLMGGQRKKPNKIPRPPNSFFLFKNALMWAAREGGGLRPTMTHLCKITSQIWEHCPYELRAKFDNMALQALELHAQDFPGYSYKPGKKQIFKPYCPGNSFANKRQRGRGQTAVNRQTGTDQTSQVLEDQHPQINPFYVDCVVDSEIMNMYLRLENEAQLKSML